MLLQMKLSYLTGKRGGFPVLIIHCQKCDNNTLSQSYGRRQSLAVSKEKMSAHLSSERCIIHTLWFKVMEIPVSPIEFEPVKNCGISLYYVFVKCCKSGLVEILWL
jgi:hypothetical protein